MGFYYFSVLSCASRSGDRPVLVCGPWGETYRALREEAQQRCGGSGQRRDAACRQDADAAASQTQEQGEPGERIG